MRPRWNDGQGRMDETRFWLRVRCTRELFEGRRESIQRCLRSLTFALNKPGSAESLDLPWLNGAFVARACHGRSLSPTPRGAGPRIAETAPAKRPQPAGARRRHRRGESPRHAPSQIRLSRRIAAPASLLTRVARGEPFGVQRTSRCRRGSSGSAPRDAGRLARQR